MTSKIFRHWMVLALLLATTLFPMVQAGPQVSIPPTPNQVKPTLIVGPLEPQFQNATVSADSGTTVMFTSFITITKPPLITVNVALSSSCSAGFPTTVTPDSIAFTQSGTVQITIAVVVPAKASMSNMIQVEVDATATMPGLSTTASSSGLLGISQYFDIGAKAETKKGSGNPQEFIITVQNTGNGNDSFKLDIADKNALEKEGFRFDFSKTMITDVPQEGNVSVGLKVSYGLSTPAGKKDIRVTITSMNSTNEGNKEVTKETSITVDVGAMGGGGSQTVLVVGLIVLIAIISVVLSFMIKRRTRVKGGKVIRVATPVKKAGDENGEDEPLKEPEEIVNDQKDAKNAEHED